MPHSPSASSPLTITLQLDHSTTTRTLPGHPKHYTDGRSPALYAVLPRWQGIMRIYSRDDPVPSPRPPSPFSYFLPLLFVVLPCIGYIWYRRKERHELNFSLRDLAVRSRLAKLAGAGGAVRLSTDGLPPTHEFLSNNASTDSLPHGVELPHLSNSRPITAQALQTPSKLPPAAAALSEKSKIVPASPARRFLRRSRRQDGPVEPDDEESEGESEESDVSGGGAAVNGAGQGQGKQAGQHAEPLFGIGDDEPEPDSPTSSPGKPSKAR